MICRARLVCFVWFLLAATAAVAAPPLAPGERPGEDEEKAVLARIAMNESDWAEVRDSRYSRGQRLWRPKAVLERQNESRYLPTTDVVVQIVKFPSVEAAEAEMARLRGAPSPVRLGEVKGLGEEAFASTGYTTPELVIVNARRGRYLLAVGAPGRETAERFGAHVFDALAEVPESNAAK